MKMLPRHAMILPYRYDVPYYARKQTRSRDYNPSIHFFFFSLMSVPSSAQASSLFNSSFSLMLL